MTPTVATTVWCASYPKSGNTWVRALLAGAVGGGEVSLSNLVGGAGPENQAFILDELGVNPSQLDDKSSYALMRAAAESVAKRTSAPIFRKTHERFKADPAEGQGHLLKTPVRAIYVVRDPRAIVPSLAWHLRVSQLEAAEVMASSPDGVLKAQFDTMVGPDVTRLMGRYLLRGARVPLDWGDWSFNVNSWLDQDAVPLTLVRYEDLVADPLTELERIVNDAGLDVDDATLRQAVEASSFERLSLQEMLVGFKEAVAPDRPFFRRGEPDAWREELEPGVERLVRSAHQPTMERLGYVGE